MFIAFCVILFLLFKLISYSVEEYEKVTERMRCVLHGGENTATDVTYFSSLTTVPRFDKGIFFVDTTCSNTGIFDLKPR